MKKQWKKRLAMLLACATLCTAFTACSSKKADTNAAQDGKAEQVEAKDTSTEGKEKVVLWHLWAGVEAGYIDDAVEAYNAQSDKYYVEALSVPDAQKIMVAIQSGNGPDVVSNFSSNVGSFAAKGIMLPLDEYVEKNQTDLSDYIPVTLESCKFEDKLYALPCGLNLMGLFYNKTLLAEAGYTEPPKTMEELYEMAVATTKVNEDGTIDVLGYPDFPSVYYMDYFAAVKAGM